MSLDDKLGPISRALGPVGRAYHRIDDEVRRYYTKVTKDKDNTRLAGIAWGVAAVAAATGYSLPSQSMSISTAMAAVHGTYLAATALPIVAKANTGHHDGTKTIDDQKIITDPEAYSLWRLVRGFRLTTLGVGCGVMIAGGAAILHGYKERDAENIRFGAGLFSLGLSSTAIASATYLIDTDPALLDKAPAWKRAVDKVKTYLSNPTGVPVTVNP